ncbi:MAG: hypothetical protein ACI9MR_003088 [Myxococcota bacterium]|jgi:hypothetical protein
MIGITIRLMMVAALSLVAACDCDTAIDEDFYDDFQKTCDGVPCSWTSSGNGAARSFAGLHEAERGVLLEEGARIERSLGGFVVNPSRAVKDMLLIMGCDPDASVTIGLALRIDGSSVPFMIEGRGGSVGQPGLVRTGYFDATLEADTVEVDRIWLERRGPGRCFVDELQFISGEVVFCNG